MKTSDIIIKPLITELAINEASNSGKYSFAVKRAAGKKQIREAIKVAFSVTPISVQTRIMKGKSKRAGTKRTLVVQTIWKKATVTLQKGDKIAIFEPGGMSEEVVE